MHRTVGTMLFAAALLAVGDRIASAQQQVIFMNGGMAIMDIAGGDLGAMPAAGAPSTGDEGALRSVGISTDGPGLVAYFHLRSRGDVKPERLSALVEQLGDKSPIAARRAAAELSALGAPAIPALRQAVKDPDRQQRARMAQLCLKALEEPGHLSAAAARLIAQRRPPGAAEALLQFLPQAEDESVIEEIRLALSAVAPPRGLGEREVIPPDPALLKALQDDSPIRRAMAVDTLCHNGVTPSVLRHVPLQKLLRDPNPTVRLRSALALAHGRDPKAVSTLITLLTELPLNQARQAEEFLTELAGDQAPKVAMNSDDGTRQKCRDAWATWWQASEDDARLLDEVRKRTVTEALRIKCEELIGKLGDADFAVRQKAQAEVKAMGSLIVPLLRRAALDRDLEVRKRARDCLSEMERDKNLPLSPIAARLIALRKPANAAEALLAYVPYCDDESANPEVQLALNAVAFKNNKPEQAIVRALSDPQSARRGAAAEALCLGGDRAHLPDIRKLLNDSELSVRLKVALALAGSGQREAVPALIDLLAELPSDRVEPAEEYLQRLAGDGAPQNLAGGDDSAARKKRQQAWAAWWKANGERVALVDRYPPEGSERYLGHILLVLANSGQIMELGPDRKLRWQLNGLENPQDVQVLGNDRILVAEWNGQRVSERNRKGEIIWEKKTPNCWPIAAQRLRNGHTFIACMNKLMEVDRAGNEIFSINRPNDVVMARRMRDGQIVVVTNQRQCLRLDTTGKQLKSFGVQWAWHQTGVDILPNGHVLIPSTWINRITEYDAEGKTVLDLTSMQPTGAARLKNGNLLVSPQQWPAKVVEMDATGKQVSSFDVANFPQRIRVR
jgi:HEAT repeat protein